MSHERVLVDGRAISQSQWDTVVERWNRLNHIDRREVRTRCVKEGHAWREFPIKGSEICVRCCSYREAT